MVSDEHVPEHVAPRENAKVATGTTKMPPDKTITSTKERTPSPEATPSSPRSVPNEKANPTSQLHIPEDKKACKKESKLKTEAKKPRHIPRQKRPFGSIRCRSVRQQCIAAMYLHFECIVLDAHIVYCRGIVRFTFQCNRYGLTEKCPCVPSARYSVMVQSKVSMTFCSSCRSILKGDINTCVFPSVCPRHIESAFEGCHLNQ